MNARPSPSHTQAYRPDIDGLRALAVLPVVLYHAEVPGFGGGFIGVDIFFVISGFLITAIIAREVDAGDFSLIRFYERRARRILPALIAMVLFVLAAASALFLPSDFVGVGASAIAALFFLANVYLFTQVGYFQGAAEETPLLHTWSLGVEEQFYIGLPLALIVIAKAAPRWRLRAIVALAAVSFAWAVFKQADTDGFAFYMLPTRAWEMLAGSLLALGAFPTVKRRWLAEALCALALIAMAAGTFFYSKHMVFPGVAALLPVLAAAALIHCAPGTIAGRIMSMRAPVWIGLISYSLYLWHWPLITFWRYRLDRELGFWDSAGLILVSLLVAWASWRFIEQPFRNRALFPAKRLWAWSAMAMGGVALVSLGVMSKGGWESRFDAQTLSFAAAANDYSPVRDACVADRVEGFPKDCTLGTGTSPSALIWGDSHGVEIAWALGEQYGARGEAIVQRTRGSCPPALGYEAAKDPRCALFNRHVMEEITANPRLSTIYLAGYWEQETYRAAGIAQALDDTIRALQGAGKQVVLLGPIPTQDVPVPRLLALYGKDAPALALAEFNADTAWFTRHYPAWRARGVRIIEPAERLTEGNRSLIVAGGEVLYYDSHHLSLAGARHILGNGDGEFRGNRTQGPDGPSSRSGD